VSYNVTASGPLQVLRNGIGLLNKQRCSKYDEANAQREHHTGLIHSIENKTKQNKTK
jgi:hypothetical protein